MSDDVRRLCFDLEWRTTVFTLVLLPLLIGLGFWQLQRADEKHDLAAAHAARQAQAPTDLLQLWDAAPDALAYRPVSVSGRFDDKRVLLLDNRIQQGRFGYEVIALLHLQDGERGVLVNRGWVAADPARRSLPVVDLPDGEVTVNGAVYVAPGKPYTLGSQVFTGDWPLVVQALEDDGLRRFLAQDAGQPVFPWPVRIDPADPLALSADWPVVNTSPAKHVAYAVQWFCMAAALLVLFILRSSNLWSWLRRGR